MIALVYARSMKATDNIVFLLIFGVVLLVDAQGDIQPPIPVESTTPGIRYMPSDPRPSVVLEIFIDLNCPDSRDGWAIMKQLPANYGPANLDLVVQQMPLPYHRNAFLCTQGMYVIENSAQSAFLFNYIEEAMLMWQDFSTANTVDMSETQVLDMLGDMANRVTGIDKALFISEVPNYRNTARTAWKFAARRGVAVTPTYFLNGVELGIGTSVPTYDDWITFLDPIILG